MRRRRVPWPKAAFLVFTFLSSHAFDACAQPGPPGDHRDRFASLLLTGSDPVAELARRRLGERHHPSPVLTSSLFAVIPAATMSGPLGGSALAEARGTQPLIATGRSVSGGSSAAMAVVEPMRRHPLPSRSIKYLQKRAARLKRKSALVFQKEARLRSIRPTSKAQEARIEHTLGILAREERSTFRKLNQIDRQIASPTAPVAAVDPLGLGSVAQVRHPGGVAAKHHELAARRR
ncbi:MAG: hypothetical protein ACYC61_06975 [Isosphaeraceae bacterium]